MSLGPGYESDVFLCMITKIMHDSQVKFYDGVNK